MWGLQEASSVSPYWIGIFEYLTWGLFAVTPAIFLPRHLAMIVVIPMVIVWTIIARLGSIFLWRALAQFFGWELPIEDDDENSN